MNITISAFSPDAMKTAPVFPDDEVSFALAEGKCVGITVCGETIYVPLASLEIVTNAMRDMFKTMRP